MRKITTITTIDAAVNYLVKQKRKVAACVRVSTAIEDQLIRLEAQKRHYKTLIERNTDWELIGIYCNEGITGTKKDKRPELLRLISDCEKGKLNSF